MGKFILAWENCSEHGQLDLSMSKFIVSIGNLFEHGQLIGAWSHYICIGNSVYFHAQNEDRSLVCANPSNIIACANIFLNGQKSFSCTKFAQARQHIGHTPRALWLGTK